MREDTGSVSAGRAAVLDVATTALPMPHVEGVTHWWVTVADGCRIHVAEAGAGAPLVLLHGWPQHWFAWRAVIPALAKRFRVICPDVRGLGWSGAAGTDWSLRRLAADVRDLLNVLGEERAGVVGHDWGSAVAYRMAMDHPDRVTGVVPLAGLHPWAATGVHPWTFVRPWHVYTGALVGPVNNTWAQVPRISLRTWRRVGAFTPAETEIYCGSVRQPGAVHATTRFYRNLLTREVPFFWRHGANVELPGPVLHVNGADDPLTRRLSSAHLGRARDMTLIDIPDCGHFLAEERPAELIELITGFFPQEC